MDQRDEAELTERRWTPRGELALRRRGGHFELISNGVFLMDTRDGRSERLLGQATLAATRSPRRVLIAGLGVGFTTAAVLANPTVSEVVVVEVESAVIDWQREHFADYAGDVRRDPRCRVLHADFVAWLAQDTTTFDAVCLDIDNGPAWTLSDANAQLYGDAGFDRLAARIGPGGGLGVWSATRDPELDQRLRARFDDVVSHDVPVARGVPDTVTVATRARS